MNIWHCPNSECHALGVILFKTDCPVLPGGVIKCPRCKKIFTFREIEKMNQKNIRKYVSGMSE
jgi:hypothetical protein